MSEKECFYDSVLQRREPMEAMATDVVSQLQDLASVRAVIFDVYGTLVISGSGDVGSADDASHDSKIEAAMRAIGLSVQAEQIPTADELHDQIRALNEARRGPSCPKPEVDIVEAWRRTLACRNLELPGNDVVRLASTFEALANPTWPMPGAGELLERLKNAKTPMGIVSNAQIFTPCLVEDLLVPKDLAAGGFDLDLCVFSNRFRQAKPGPRLFDVLREGLARRRISPHEAIYVGNDMLNDVWAASQAGLRTAWFAGDARSCRRREDDPRCRSLRPDLVVTTLLQLLECLHIK